MVTDDPQLRALYEEMTTRREDLPRRAVDTVIERNAYTEHAVREALEDQQKAATRASVLLEQRGETDQAEAMDAYAGALRAAAPPGKNTAPAWMAIAGGLRNRLEPEQMEQLHADPRIQQTARISAESALMVWDRERPAAHTIERAAGYTRDLEDFNDRAVIAQIEGRPIVGSRMEGVRSAVMEVSTDRQLMALDSAVIDTKLQISEMTSEPDYCDWDDVELLSDQLDQWDQLGVPPVAPQAVIQERDAHPARDGSVGVDERTVTVLEPQTETEISYQPPDTSTTSNGPDVS